MHLSRRTLLASAAATLAAKNAAFEAHGSALNLGLISFGTGGAEQLNNLIIGDTPAGPLVDRALCVGRLLDMDPAHLITIRTAMLPGGYAIFIQPETADVGPLRDKLLQYGYEIADEVQAPSGATAIRAR